MKKYLVLAYDASALDGETLPDQSRKTASEVRGLAKRVEVAKSLMHYRIYDDEGAGELVASITTGGNTGLEGLS